MPRLPLLPAIGLLLATAFFPTWAIAADSKPEVYFVVTDETPIRDAATGKSLGMLERGEWLRRTPGGESFRCYDPWRQSVTVDSNDILPLNEARLYFDKRLEKRPSAEDYADRAAIARYEESYSKCIADLNRSLALDPNLYRALRRRAECLYGMAMLTGDADKWHRLAEDGLKDADRCVELRPDDFLAYDKRYLLRSLVFGIPEALDDIKKALELRPDHPPLYNNRGKLLVDLGRLDEALVDLNRAIQLDPEYSDAFTNRGTVYHHRRQFDAAIADAGHAIEYDPLNVSAWNNRGNGYMEKKEWNKAIADFSEVIRLTPDSSDGYFGRANVYFTMGNDSDQAEYVLKGLPVPSGERKSTPSFHKAIVDCDAALKRNARDYKCLNTKGVVLKKLDKPREAIEIFDQAMSTIEKESREQHYTVADDNGAKQDAWNAVEKMMAAAEAPATFDAATHRVALAHPHRATIAAIMGNRADAWRMLLQDQQKPDLSAGPKMLNDLTRAILFDPQNADLFRVRGYFNLEFQRWPQAVSDLSRALELRPDYADALHGRVIAYLQLRHFNEAWDDVRRLEKLGTPIDGATLDRLRKASNRER